MSTSAHGDQLAGLFRRTRVTMADEQVFMAKLALCAVFAATGVSLALQPGIVMPLAGAAVLGALYTHLVELQHQCLHHSAFRNARLHRMVGIPLGVPMLVSYSHYRVRHLQHHHYLGTPEDSEFFGFDTQRPLTWQRLLVGLFDYQRLLTVGRDICRATARRWTYDLANIPERRRQEITTEYRLLGLAVLAAILLAVSGHAHVVLWLWLVPLLLAIPLHFLVELPEHILCDRGTTNVLRNTRSIRGSRLSTWFTNGNNLHIEHHAAMMVPINHLPARHALAAAHAKYVTKTYPAFFRELIGVVRENSHATREPL